LSTKTDTLYFEEKESAGQSLIQWPLQ